MSASLMPLDDDQQVPAGSMVADEVLITHYLRPDGTFGIRVHYSGEGSLSQALGLLTLAAVDLYVNSGR